MANENIYPPFNYKLGRPLKYQPDELLQKFQEFVIWAKENPIVVKQKTVNTTTQGKTYGNEAVVEKPRLVSISAFLVYLGAGRDWWESLDRSKKGGEDFSRVKAFIRDYCESYQTEMATNELFNANIISRLLGLADRVNMETKMEVGFKFGEE